MSPSHRHQSQSRIDALVRAARAETHMSVSEIMRSRVRRAVSARHGIWRELYSAGFGASAIARTWGCHPSSVHAAIFLKTWARNAPNTLLKTADSHSHPHPVEGMLST